MEISQTILNEDLFVQGVRLLADRDAHLAEVVETYGQPPLWVREPGFPTLVYIILEQQVSLASAKAAFDRLNASVRPLSPRGFLKLTDAELLRIGFSRQKTLYTRLLADSLARRHFDLRYLHDLHDDAARKMLIALKGIGRWTADIYLLSALRRPDIWPLGDLALATAVQERLPVIVVLINDHSLTLIKAIQERRYQSHFLGVDLLNPDFGLFAKAFGVRYWRADTDPAFESALREAIPSNEPALIEVQLRP